VSKFTALEEINRKHGEQLKALKQRTAGAEWLLRRPVAFICKEAHQLLCSTNTPAVFFTALDQKCYYGQKLSFFRNMKKELPETNLASLSKGYYTPSCKFTPHPTIRTIFWGTGLFEIGYCACDAESNAAIIILIVSAGLRIGCANAEYHYKINNRRVSHGF
jgi:hypothetical protein